MQQQGNPMADAERASSGKDDRLAKRSGEEAQPADTPHSGKNDQKGEPKRKRKHLEEGKAVTKPLGEGNQLSLYAQIKKAKTKVGSKGGRKEPIADAEVSPSSEEDDVIEEENDLVGQPPREEAKKKKKKEKEKKKEKKKKQKEQKEQTKQREAPPSTPLSTPPVAPPDGPTDEVSPSDYERLLASEKNNSAIWVSYIAYHLEKGSLEEARKTAERALKTIDIHKVEEKRNIFFCYINMECTYGDKLREIFKRALLCCNEKKVYIHTMNVLKVNKKYNQLKQLSEEAIKKFHYSKKIWSHYLEIIHSTFKDEAYAHEILLKSLHCLAKRKHLRMVINAARFEYKYANKERGKSYFEKLIQEYPKRSDVWFTYLDIHINSLTKSEIKGKKKKLNLNQLEFVRNIFERFSSCKFKTRVMKMIFTKWLLFEKNHGSVASQKMVQKKAYDYVESLNALA
ncbi:rRNA biogenesis protein RRP5, putative [Plasmodium vivax]|uniref:rRNA biogenesis protein RRP5 n=3 Tax=Plasmodium vivax TaxID=5855 RepID=A0A0J9TNA9_PLAVI|nr:hypothetical protein PVBG_01054 [Plasmodium vivax Brazil I]KMZ97285.1 hypothetical protein PVNG_05081 [Plasmodium vivax North Korean]CAG9476278.1 unnamed protein product [Plasmodium vivax]CAI7723088.1 rRNA biogenesis protein RRP5, putative [Plasmodium vivax]SCO69545.1 rRNA biogenesis protein RRP5, putative [Plasmodium vivax]